MQDIDDGLLAMRGMPVDNLIKILGYPDGETTVAGRRLLVWSTNRTVNTVTPVTNYTTSSASAYGSGGYAYGTGSSTTTSYVPVSYNYNCTIRVEIDRSERIVGHDFQGNIGGCSRYSQAIAAAIGPA